MARSPNIVEIDLGSIIHNLNQVKRLLDPKTMIMGIVKSDAYGHGLLQVSKLLEENGVHSLGVAHLHEALELRKTGIKLPIVILCGIRSREDAKETVYNYLTPVVFNLHSAELLAKEAARKGKRVDIHLKIDTGMGRLGINHKDAGPFMKKIMEYPSLNLQALMSHLSSAEDPDSGFTGDQIGNFKSAIDAGHAMGLDLPFNNLANSAGIMAHKSSHFNMVRPGIMLYGGLPSPEFHPPSALKPVMGFRGQVLQIRDFKDNIPVSYGRKYYTEGPKKIAVVSAGYGDGVPRSMSNRGKVLIAGEKVSIVGTVCMNMIMCDITGISDVMPGDEAVFLGSQGDKTITGDDMAEWSDTISYEIFLSIGQRAIKEYL